MLLSTVNLLISNAIFLIFLQTPSAYQLSSIQWRNGPILPPERELVWPYWSDDIDSEEESIIKKSASLPPSLERLKKFQSLKDKEKYVAALNTYYMIFGRPR